MTSAIPGFEGDQPFRTIFEHAAVGVGLVGATGIILHANPRLCELFGCGLEELVGKSIADVTYPDDRDADLALFDELVRGVRSSYKIEKRYLRADGTIRWGRLTTSLVRGADGSVQYAIGMVEDISELRELSHAIGERVKELNALHALSRRLLRAASDDVPTLLQFVADLLPPAFQYPEITEAQVTLGDTVVRTRGFASGHATLCAAWEGAGTSGDAPPGRIEVQYSANMPQADEGPFLAEERSLIDSIADLLRIAVIGIREARQRDLAQQALQVSEDRLQVALAAASMGTIEWDLPAQTAKISSVTRELYGFPDDVHVVTGEDMLSRIHPDDRMLVQRAFREESAGAPERVHEFRLQLPDGTIRWVMVRGRVFFDSAGIATRRIGVNIDVTGRHALEAQFRHAQKMEAVGRLAGGVAHDFNNLLTVIGAAAEFAHLEAPPDSQLRSDVQDITDAVGRARSLTSQLLTFSRRQVVRPSQLELSDVVRNTEKMLRRLVGADVSLTVVLSDVAVPVRADSGQLEQVLVNLVVNARDAMPDGGTIAIATSVVHLDDIVQGLIPELAPGHYAVLTVSDTGTGMDEDTRARIFDPFFTTKEAGKGTGLGLATVFGIVKQAGGHIAVYTEVGLGATFRVYLPRHEPSGDESNAAEPVVASISGGDETILLVEDEPHVRLLARRILIERGYAVIEAGDGDEAIEVAAEHNGPLHLLLTDVVLPERNGGEVAELLLATRPDLKVLMMSGYTADALLLHRITEAGTPFIEKPFTRDGLAAAVRSALDRDRR